jgi:Family of unknown function (DUF6527)
MMRHSHLEHRFVQHIPDGLESGVLYISMEYGTAAHRCCCGCGEEVVTPFTPTDWKMTFDGDTVSLSPSIGNWTLACRSHYVIKRGRVIEAGPWTDKQVEAERHRDRAVKARFYGVPTPKATVAILPETEIPTEATRGMVDRVLRWLNSFWI